MGGSLSLVGSDGLDDGSRWKVAAGDLRDCV